MYFLTIQKVSSKLSLSLHQFYIHKKFSYTITILGLIINICFYETFSNPSPNVSTCASLLNLVKLKALALLFQLGTLSIQKPKPLSLVS
jgi:hypothetical protein